LCVARLVENPAFPLWANPASSCCERRPRSSDRKYIGCHPRYRDTSVEEIHVSVLTVLPDDERVLVKDGETILEALHASGFGYRTGCKGGGCG